MINRLAENCNRPGRFLGIAGIVWGLLTTVPPDGRAEEPPPTLIRLAFSSEVFSGVNENDARAAVKAWTHTIAGERRIRLPAEPIILPGLDKVVAAFRDNQVDACSITAIEYEATREWLASDEMLTATYQGVAKEQYVLLVRSESGWTNVSHLRGRRLLAFDNARTCLALCWLDLLLAEKGYGRASNFFGGIRKESKLTRVVLPVFFGQTDVCLVTRRGFESMIELNPQLGRRLRALETSPPYLPGMFCFRRQMPALDRQKLVEAILELDRHPAGRQMLTLFQAERIELRPTHLLDSALELLQRHRALPQTPSDPVVTSAANPAAP